MVLKRQAQPTTPQGLPTVAAQMAQQAQQQMQPPGVMQAAQQAGIAAPILQQQQQDAQTQQIAQMAAQQVQQQMQQQPQAPQQMAHGGIARLRADNMARLASYSHGGGVLHFANEGLVPPTIKNPDVDEEGIPRTNEERARVLRDNQALMQMQSNLQALNARNEALERVRATSQPVPEQMEKYYRSTGREKAAFLGLPPGADEGNLERVASAPTTVGSTSLTPQQIEQSTKQPTALTTGTTSRPSGIAGARPAPVNPDVERLRTMLAQAPEAVQSPESYLAQQQKLTEAARSKYGLTGNIGSASEQAIANAAARDEDLRRQFEAGKEGRGLENLIANFAAARGGAGALGQAYVSQTRGQRAADLQFEQLMNASAAKRDEMNILLQNSREAAAKGDVDRAEALRQQAIKSKAESDHYRLTAGASLAHTTVSAQTEEKKIASDAANRAAHERGLDESRKQSLLRALSDDLALKATKLQDEAKAKDPAYMMASFAMSNGTATKEQAALIQKKQEDFERELAPLRMQRQQIMESLGLGAPSGIVQQARKIVGG